jgi:ammonium transporter
MLRKNKPAKFHLGMVIAFPFLPCVPSPLLGERCALDQGNGRFPFLFNFFCLAPGPVHCGGFVLKKWFLSLGVLSAMLLFLGTPVSKAEEQASTEPTAEEKAKAEVLAKIKEDTPGAVYDLQKLAEGISPAQVKADSAWMLISTALVMLMVPGLALFYCGMVRRKNVLATMMHSMVALSVVGVYWFAIGYSLAFGDPWISLGKDGSILGFSKDLLFLQGVNPARLLPNTNIPIYLHMLFQGMFAIITPALISGAVAERIRFKPYCIFLLIWVTFVYCPLAHCVWALDWNWNYAVLDASEKEKFLEAGAAKISDAKGKEEFINQYANSGKSAVGYLGKMGALDFAGGTVVHIAAGFSSLACIMLLRRRLGYPEHAIHPNSMVLTLTGAGILWFGWFGFNGGSAGGSGELAVSAFAATQLAAAAAGLSWMLMEWFHRGKPTALGLASGIVAGLVAVTPASGFVYAWGGLIIGLIAGVVCYLSVTLKPLFKYDDSLDAFGVHGVGGFLGAVLTGFFSSKVVNPIGFDSFFVGSMVNGKYETNAGQVWIQFFAAAVSAVVAFVFSLVIVKVVDLLFGFVTDEKSEIDGLDRTEHGETGFDFGLTSEAAATGLTAEPRSASAPPPHGKRFQVALEGAPEDKVLQVWAEMCQPNTHIAPEFKAVYPYVTTVQGNRFQFRGGDQNTMKDNLQRLFQGKLNMPVKARIEG